MVAVGHAIVDVLAHTDDAHVAGFGLTKGTMTLVEGAVSERIYAALGSTDAVSGGSAANTAVGVVAIGGSASFVGKVSADPLGRTFTDDIRAAGVGFDVVPAQDGPGTGRCIVMVTPDAERTMCTDLGVGDLLPAGDIDPALIGSAGAVYIEGYLCGLEHTEGTVEASIAAAERAGTTVALSVSDPFWVELHGSDMAKLLDRVQILFANEQEACLLTGIDELKPAVAALARRCETVVVTRGPAGSVVSSQGSWAEVAAEPVGRIVDTTGAGDLYAAGYLYAHLRGAPPESAARLGGLAAAEIISHLGARPASSLRDIAAGLGLSSD